MWHSFSNSDDYQKNTRHHVYFYKFNTDTRQAQRQALWNAQENTCHGVIINYLQQWKHFHDV